MIIVKSGFEWLDSSRGEQGRSRRGVRLVAEVLESRQLLAVIMVNSSGDADGPDGSNTLSLRQAIEVSNGTLPVGSLTLSQATLVVGPLATPNTIDFNIAGTGPFFIEPTSSLPTITSPVLIDGYSQPGALPNTNGPDQADNAVLEIELNGLQAGRGATGLHLNAGGSVVKGLAIGGFGPRGGNYDAIGILIDGPGGNLIEGNYLGTDITGTQPLLNDRASLQDAVGTDSNTIGGSTAGARNVVDGGLNMFGSSNLIQGNFIGIDSTGTVAAPTNQYGNLGIEIFGKSNTLGGTTAGTRNVISGNPDVGLLLGGSSDLIEGNFFGTDLTGSKAIPNGTGISIDFGGDSNTIGGTSAGTRNIISGNANSGLLIYSARVENLVEGNFIGTDLTGSKALPNEIGVRIVGGDFNTIGGTSAGAGNVISGNKSDGVDLAGPLPGEPPSQGMFPSDPATNNVIEGNLIGTDPTGTIALPNVRAGISIAGGMLNMIGGTIAGAGNVIAYNGKGVIVGAGFYEYQVPNPNAAISGNSIFANVGPGIDLGNDGLTPNPPSGSTTRPNPPNRFQPYPVLTSAIPTSTGSLISSTLYAAPSTSYTVEFFANNAADPSGFGQGQTYIGSEVVTTDGAGHVAFTFETPPIGAGRFLSATATDPLGNTSEFAADLVALSTTTTQLGVSPVPVFIGGSLTLVANVGATPGVGTPIGKVDFTEDGLRIGSINLDRSGLGSLTIPAFTGTHTFTASFEGSSTDAGSSSNPMVVTAAKLSSAIVLHAPTSPLTIGSPLTLLAVVTSAEGVMPIGRVDFTEDGLPIGSTILDASGVGSLTIPVLSGSHTYSATFLGSATEAGSTSSQIIVTALKQSTTTTLQAPTSLATLGQSVTFTALVTGGPTGMVAFTVNGVLLGDAPLDSSGVARFSTDRLPVGPDNIQAEYLGDPIHSSSFSNVVAQGVLPTNDISISISGPTVTSAVITASHTVRVSFSRPLLVSHAQALANYAIIGPGGHYLKLKSVVYRAAKNSVTLTTRQTLNPRLTYELMVNGVRVGRVIDTHRVPLAGRQGKPGTNYFGKITPKGPQASSVHAMSAGALRVQATRS